ncbi:protein kinase [bacterium]|nr:protein kinase [bacterium]
MIGQVIGDYRILKQLGEGGMGAVYLGEHHILKQRVALKALLPALFSNSGARDRFVREAEVLARLNHPNIIRLLNFYNIPQGCFIVMEFAEGETLEDKLQKTGLIPTQQAVPQFVQILRALGNAHRQGIVHRDLKPSNIMVTSEGVAKLLDFGTAKLADAPKLTQQGMTLGTMIYMSKEQLLGKPLDARSDVYSLGVTLYETTTGQLPFYDQDEKELVKKIAKADPIPPSTHYPPMPKDLEQIILKAMAKDPDNRFASADEMADALERTMAGAPAATGIAAASPVATQPLPASAIPRVSPTPAPAPAPAAQGGGSSPLLHPLVLIGIFLVLVGIGLGVGLMLIAENKLPGLLVAGVGVPLGFLMAVVGFVLASKGPSVPAAKPTCPKCGRALLKGMAECPFCKEAMPGGPQLTMPQPAGGTVNQTYQPPPPGTYAMPAGPAPAAGTGILYIVDGADKGKQYPLGPTSAVTMGRAPGNTIILNDPGVSSNHCSIVHDGARYVLQDLGSRNGVFVNNTKVQRQPLNGGDLVVLGTTRILVNVKG